MNQHRRISVSSRLALSLGAALLTIAAGARESDDSAKPQIQRPVLEQPPGEIEEVVVVGRLLSAAEALTDERIKLPFSADFLGFEVMARAGDTDIAQALRRVPGLTVIDGKFVYVRGLGERYSSVLVNGAAVPSPDLTRSVIPLDLFPTSIVESVKIQKSPSPDQPASFGGGTIDLRSSSIPDDVIATAGISVGLNNASDSAGLVYARDGGPLPGAIRDAISAYRGDISVGNIFNTLNFGGNGSLAAAQTIQQGLIDSLNTNVAPGYQSLDPDFGAKVSLGNSWYLGKDENWRFGALVNGVYSEQWRNETQLRESIGSPSVNFFNIDRTIYEERTVAAANFGLSWLEDHSVELIYYDLQNDEAQASIARGFDSNTQFPEQRIDYGTRLEERQLVLTQLSGSHVFADTPWVGDVLSRLKLQDLEFDWGFSDSKASTSIPNQANFTGNSLLDPNTGRQVTTQLLSASGAGQFFFLELEDDMTSWGGDVRLPLEFGKAAVTLSSGWWGSKKSRSYYGNNVNLNAVGVGSSNLSGPLADILAPSNLAVSNGFNLSLGAGIGNESYLAAQKVDAGYGMVDMTYDNTWRFTAGARYENYQQAVLPLDLLDFSGNSITNLNNQLADANQKLAIGEDDTYGSLAVSYLGTGLFGADDYQVRFSFGQTVVRPDLREISDVVFLDPELGIQVRGNPLLKTSPIDNFELRGEFYYASGDNFTVSLFHKIIDSAIERIRTAGSDDNISLTFTNAQKGDITGFELEGLKSLWRGLFVSGNMTLSDSELSIDTSGITGGPTNGTRRLTGHSEWVVNATLGFDSDNAKHSAFLNWNAFGERIFYGGVAGNHDAFEQPFQSLGVVYKYYPIDRLEITFRADNILDEKREFEQLNNDGDLARILVQDVGMTFNLQGRWQF